MRQRRALVPGFVALALIPLLVLGFQSRGERSAEHAAVDDSTTHYLIDAQIQPTPGQFDVAVDMRFVPDAPTDALRFLLHDALTLQTLTASAEDGYSTSRWRLGGLRCAMHTVIASSRTG
jgi:hypothetical protein